MMKAVFLLHAVVFTVMSASASPIVHCCASASILVHAPPVVAVKDQNLIHATCKRTPLYDLCATTLLASSKSATADVTGLALIMADALLGEAKRTLQRIDQLRKAAAPKDKALRWALANCAGRYDVVVKADVPVVVEALTKGDPKFAESNANDAAVEAKACERGLGTNSPLTQNNKRLTDLADVTASIVRLLL